MASKNKFSVAAESHVEIAFGIEAPAKAELHIDYLNGDALLAKERRPLSAGVESLALKTHPDVSHIVCDLVVDGRPATETTFTTSDGKKIDSVGQYFIVVGAMKAGTTTLFHMLKQHPAICQTWVEVPGLSTTKEINYFQKLYSKTDRATHYDWRFPFSPVEHSWTLDVSPNYAKLPRTRAVPQRMSKLGGMVKLAYIMRDPIDRIESHIAHGMHVGRPLRSLKHCTRLSQYATHLDGFAEFFPRKDILLLDFETLRNQPRQIMAEICDFLEVDRSYAEVGVHNSRATDFALNSDERASIAQGTSAGRRAPY